MTVEVFPGPGTESYRSARFAVTVDGHGACYVYQAGRTVEFAVPGWWDLGDTVPVSFVTYAADVATTCTVTLLSGAITSVEVYPKALKLEHTISGGTLSITMPAGSKARIEVNGDKAQCLCLFADDTLSEPVGGATVYNGTQTSAVGGATLYFPPGVHNLTTGAWGGPLFPMAGNSTIYLAGGAWVIGTLDTRAGAGLTIKGHGVLSGEFISNETVSALPTFDERYAYSLVWGYVPGVFPTGCTIRNVTLTRSPFYTIAEGFNVAEDVKIINPWTDNSDGIKLLGDPANGYNLTIRNCWAWCGDDVLDMSSFRRNILVEGCQLQTSGSSCFLFSYYATNPDAGYTTVIRNNYVRACADYYLSGGGGEGGNTIQCWTDGVVNRSDLGRYRVTFDGLWVEGGVINSTLLWIGNRLYPWGTPRDGWGQIGSWTLRNIDVESVPAERSKIRGLDYTNTPHHIYFWSLRIGGTAVTSWNYSEFFDVNEFPRHIYFGGRLVTDSVDICNLALSHIGETAVVTDITGVDTSAQALLCQRFYPRALADVLESHNWPFCTKRATLTAVEDSGVDAWAYCYELPDDVLRVLSVVPPEWLDDYQHPGEPIKFALEQDSSGTLRLFTSQVDAVLRYTAFITDVNLMSPLAIHALTWHLAGMLAGPIIKGDVGAAEAKRCATMANSYMAKASTSSSNQRKVNNDPNPSWIARR